MDCLRKCGILYWDHINAFRYSLREFIVRCCTSLKSHPNYSFMDHGSDYWKENVKRIYELDKEKKGLKTYLTRGNQILKEDFHGSFDFDAIYLAEMYKVNITLFKLCEESGSGQCQTIIIVPPIPTSPENSLFSNQCLFYSRDGIGSNEWIRERVYHSYADVRMIYYNDHFQACFNGSFSSGDYAKKYLKDSILEYNRSRNGFLKGLVYKGPTTKIDNKKKSKKRWKRN